MDSSHIVLVIVHTTMTGKMVSAKKFIPRGRGVAHGDAQMKQKHAVSIILSCDDVTQQDAGKTNHSNHTSTKLHTFTSVVMFHAQKSMRRGQGVAHGDAQMKQKHAVSIILSCDVATSQEGGRKAIQQCLTLDTYTFLVMT